MLDRLPLRDLVRHQVAVALAVERSLETEDPLSPRCEATAAMAAPQERASGSADEGPFFAKQPALSAQAQVLLAKAPPAVLFETDLSEQRGPLKSVAASEVTVVPAKPSGMSPPAQVAVYFEERTVIATVPREPPHVRMQLRMAILCRSGLSGRWPASSSFCRGTWQFDHYSEAAGWWFGTD